MILTLEATGPQAAALGAQCRRVFSSAGGVIGRAKNSDWVLAHAKVSSRHALISYLDGVFYIEDTSTNGVFINSPHNRLVAGRRYALQSGDRIFIDPYEIDVSVSGRHEALPNPFDNEDVLGPQPPRHTPPLTPRHSLTPEPVPSEELDPLKLIGSESKRTPVGEAPSVEDLNHRSVLSDHYRPPAVLTPPSPARPTPEPFLIPADYDPLRDDFVQVPAPPSSAASALPDRPLPTPPSIEPPRGAPPPVPPSPAIESTSGPAMPSAPPPIDEQTPPAPAQQTTDGLAVLLEGAGLKAVSPSVELARNVGEIFRVVVSGVMDVLRSRQQVKDEFRLRMTHFRPADNNPLKFSANVDDALHNLLVKRNAAYLEPVQAFEDAFDDLRNHQLAVLAGMRVAFESMLTEFDPDRLEKHFERQLKRIPFLRVIARLRYWDLYRDWRDEIAKDPDASFKKLFGEEFARAYEEQLNRLKAESRAAAAADVGIRSSGRR